MYSQMKTLACRFQSSYQNIFEQVAKLLEDIQQTAAEKLQRISQKITELQRKATKEAKEEAKKLEEQKEALERELRKHKVRTIILTISFYYDTTGRTHPISGLSSQFLKQTFLS